MPFSKDDAEREDGGALTLLLRRWANARRVTTSQSATIRQAALTATPDLGFDWWWRLLDPAHGTATQAWSMQQQAEAPQRTPPDSFAWPAAAWTGANSWPQDDASNYVPYLRLT